MANQDYQLGSPVDSSFEEWVTRNEGTTTFISLLSKFGITSRLSLQHLKEDEATELFERMNCMQRSLLRGLIISLSSSRHDVSEKTGYSK